LNNLIVFYAKQGNKKKLEELKKDAIEKNDHSSAALICFFLGDGNSAIQSLKSSKEFSLAALFNSKGDGNSQDELIQNWETEIQNKYKSITFASFSK
jgi:hypothetical protein